MEKIRIPILRFGDCLITSPQVTLHDEVAIQFKNDILDKIIETKVRGLIFDVSAIDVVDSFLVRQIGELVMTASIMGTTVVVVGLRPEVAMSLVEMGLSLEKIQTARDLEKGLEILRKSQKSYHDAVFN